VSASERSHPPGLHEAAWPDMFANLQSAYAELAEAQFELEQRAAEINEARELFQQVVESMSEMLFLMDRTGHVVRVNPAVVAVLQRSEAELVGKPFAEVCGRPDIPGTPWQLLQRAPDGKLANLDIEIRAATGATVPVSVSVALVRDKRGKITGVLAVARDITERKRAEEALAHQAAELARSNAELGQFAYVASHDLQEPLRMIASFAQLLAKRYEGRLDADADEFIGYITDGAGRMQRLISDLLSYSRIGRTGKQLAPTDCAKVMDVVRSNLRAAIREAQAEITTDPLPMLLGNETQLVQLFQNLIGNAIKFRADRPVTVHLGATRQGKEWCFTVRDNGIGFDPQYADRVFMIFQRLHARSEYPGTGIGLAICKKIVDRHGGRIWVQSAPDNGTTFFFTLPAQDAPGPGVGG